MWALSLARCHYLRLKKFKGRCFSLASLKEYKGLFCLKRFFYHHFYSIFFTFYCSHTTRIFSLKKPEFSKLLLFSLSFFKSLGSGNVSGAQHQKAWVKVLKWYSGSENNPGKESHMNRDDKTLHHNTVKAYTGEASLNRNQQQHLAWNRYTSLLNPLLFFTPVWSD